MKALITMKQEVDKFGSAVEVIETDYINFANRHKLKPIVYSSIVNYSDEELLENDIFILTGGGSISLKYMPQTEGAIEQKRRDIFEHRLIRLAIEHGKLLLGICRGMQLINCFFGGSISPYSYKDRLVRVDHKINLLGKYMTVNNFHNFCVYRKNLGTNLIAIGLDEQYDIVEAFSSAKNDILGLQWHPERNFEEAISQKITDDLITKFLNGGGLAL